MERDLQFQAVFAGGEVYGAGGYSPVMSVEEAYVNGVLSFQSLLNEPSLYDAYYYEMMQPNEPPSLYDACCYQMTAPEYPPSIMYSFFNEKIPSQVDISDDVQKLKMPKLETFNVGAVCSEPFNVGAVCSEPFNFFAETTTTTQMPSLDSFSESGTNLAMQNLQFETGSARPYKSQSTSTAAKRKRQKIGEKARCLEKLLPWDKKMDMATMLEETYKYVKFLEAQISVLQSMPAVDDAAAATLSASSSTDTAAAAASSSPEALKKLNRQQLLEIVVNSREAQTLLTSKGCCVYSVEQLLLLDNIAQTRLLFPCFPI